MDISGSYDTFLQLATQEFEYPRSDLAPNTRFIGPVFSPPAAMPIPKWWGDLDGSRPVVHVTQGTIDNHDLTRLIGPTVRGLAHSDVIVIVVVSTGGWPIDDVGAVPPNVRVAEFLPYKLLMPLTDVYVTNGGFGGVQYALSRGVPMVVAGDAEDKPEVAARSKPLCRMRSRRGLKTLAATQTDHTSHSPVAYYDVSVLGNDYSVDPVGIGRRAPTGSRAWPDDRSPRQRRSSGEPLLAWAGPAGPSYGSRQHRRRVQQPKW